MKTLKICMILAVGLFCRLCLATRLHDEIVFGNLAAVKLLVADGWDVNGLDAQWRTPLHIAAAYNQVAIVEFLLEQRGIEVRLADNAEQTPLHVAVREGHAEVVRRLMAHGGANVNLPDRMMRTPLDYARGTAMEPLLRQGLADQARVRLGQSGTIMTVVAELLGTHYNNIWTEIGEEI